MSITLVIAGYLLIPFIFLGMRRLRFTYRAFWLAAVMANLVLWTAILLLRLAVPAEVSLAAWETQGGYETSLLLDPTSWVFAFILASLNLAGLLTDITRPGESNWATWAAGTGLTGLGLLAVLSGNPVTLVLAWLAIDLAELGILIDRDLISPTREQVVVTTFMRITGSFLVVAALLQPGAERSASFFFENPSSLTNLLLLAGAALRLGLLPFFPPRGQETFIPRGLGNSLRFIPAASSLILVMRVANMGGVSEWMPFTLLICGVVAVYSAFRWFTAIDEIAGRYYWLMGMCTLAFASAIKAQPAASLAWSLALFLPGGMLMLASMRNRLTLPLGIASLVMLSSLPFTPTWNGLWLYAPPFTISLVFLLAAQAVLLAGYARHFFKPVEAGSDLERWSWQIYLWGLIILPVVYLVISYWQQLLWSGPTGADLLPLLGVAMLAGLMLFLLWRKIHLPKQWSSVLERIFSLRWLLQIGMFIYRAFSRVTNFTSLILEAEGGVLWSLLFLILFLGALLGASAGR